jgi:hypothetical protein
MSDLYPEKRIEQKRQISFYGRAETSCVPQDYFELMKQRLGTEFNEIFVEKNTCDKICGKPIDELESIKEQMTLLTQRLDKVEAVSATEEEIQELKLIPEDEAKEKISAFIDDNPGARTSDIICELGLDPKLTITVLQKLQQEKKITAKKIER